MAPIADYPLSPQASSAAWTGEELVAWDYELRAGAYDPARDAWSKLPDLPLHFAECYPQSARAGEVLIAWFCGQGATAGLTGSWHRMPQAPGEVYDPVSAGDVVLFLSARHAPGLWAFKPAEEGT